MAAHSSILDWRIPGMAEPGGLLSKGSHRVGHDWSDLAAAAVFTLKEHYLREQLKSFQNFDSVWRKEAGTVCSWCLAEKLAATLRYSFLVAWMYNASKVVTAVELGKRLKIRWCFDEKVSWLVLSESLFRPQSQLCNIFKTAIFAYFWNVNKKNV